MYGITKMTDNYLFATMLIRHVGAYGDTPLIRM